MVWLEWPKTLLIPTTDWKLSWAGEIGGGLNHLAPLLEFTQLNQNSRNTLSGLLESGQLNNINLHCLGSLLNRGYAVTSS